MNALSQMEVTRTIALEWGLTIREARNVMKYPSYCAAPIRHEGKFVGVFYMDSTSPDAFGDIDDDPIVVGAIEKAAKETGLSKDIAEIIGELKSASANLEIS